jgi:hypothetical protein
MLTSPDEMGEIVKVLLCSKWKGII